MTLTLQISILVLMHDTGLMGRGLDRPLCAQHPNVWSFRSGWQKKTRRAGDFQSCNRSIDICSSEGAVLKKYLFESTRYQQGTVYGTLVSHTDSAGVDGQGL